MSDLKRGVMGVFGNLGALKRKSLKAKSWWGEVPGTAPAQVKKVAEKVMASAERYSMDLGSSERDVHVGKQEEWGDHGPAGKYEWYVSDDQQRNPTSLVFKSNRQWYVRTHATGSDTKLRGGYAEAKRRADDYYKPRSRR